MSSSATKIQPDNIQTFKVPGTLYWMEHGTIMDKDETDKIVKRILDELTKIEGKYPLLFHFIKSRSFGSKGCISEIQLEL